MDVRLFVQAGPTSLVEDGLTETLSVDVPGPSNGRVTQLARLHRAVGSFSPDAVVTFMATSPYALTRATSAAARRAAWIITARGNVILRRFVQNPAMFAAHVHWFRQAERIVTNSSALAANMFATMGASLAHKVVVVPNILVPFAIDVEEARSRVKALVGAARGPIIGCLGSFQGFRNYRLMADALALIRRVRPDAHLLIMGRTTGAWYSAESEAFRARIETLGLRQHVTMAGEVANGRALLAGLDVFALPSTLEGSSNALAEAMLAGTATATVPVADARELVGDAGVVSHGWTPTAFAEAVLAALDDASGLRVRAGERGRILAHDRSPASVGLRWVQVVEEAVAIAGTRQSSTPAADT